MFFYPVRMTSLCWWKISSSVRSRYVRTPGVVTASRWSHLQGKQETPSSSFKITKVVTVRPVRSTQTQLNKSRLHGASIQSSLLTNLGGSRTTKTKTTQFRICQSTSVVVLALRILPQSPFWRCKMHGTELLSMATFFQKLHVTGRFRGDQTNLDANHSKHDWWEEIRFHSEWSVIRWWN